MTFKIKSKFQECREKKGLTQADVSVALNVSQGMVARIETKDKEPSWKIAIRLSEIYEVPLDDFVENWERGTEWINRKEN